MDQRFLNAQLIPARVTIAGYHLAPWCLKHRMWLMGINSPFVQDNATLTVADLIIALKVCSGADMGRLSLHDRWTAIRLSLSPKAFEHACKAFVGHLDSRDTWPRFWERKNSSGNPDSTPWPLAIIVNLVKHGVTYAEAQEMPEAKAIWLSSAFAISDGAKLDFLSTEMESEIESFLAAERARTN